MGSMQALAFRGASAHSLDDKARLIVPKRFLDRLPPVETNFVLTASPDGCLLLLDQKSFEEIAVQLGGDPLDRSKQNRGLRRLILGHAEDVKPDKTGRILIPEVLRGFMGLGDSRDVVVVGTGNAIELWAPDRWNRARDDGAGSLSDGTTVESAAG
jgi:MraZ protein